MGHDCIYTENITVRECRLKREGEWAATRLTFEFMRLMAQAGWEKGCQIILTSKMNEVQGGVKEAMN